MSNYKINFIYNNDSKDTINDILLKTLKKEINFNLVFKNNKNKLLSQCTNLSTYNKESKSEL